MESDEARRGKPVSAGAAVCGACGRFIGGDSACAYCQAGANRPLVARALRTGAVALSLLGLATLYLAATRGELPLVRAEAITPMMNHAYVRIAGRVERAPYIVRRDGDVDYLSFLVNDGTGLVRVQVSRDVARQVIARGLLPERGARIACAGALNLASDTGIKLRLQAPQHLTLF